MELTLEQKYNLLSQISSEIRSTLDLNEILNRLLDMLARVIHYDAAGIFVLNQDLVHSRLQQPKELIASVVWRGFPERPPQTDPMLSTGEGIIGHVIKSGEFVVAPDVRQDPRYVVGRQATLSEIAVPILRNNRPIGALNLESDSLNAYGAEDLEVLQFFSDAAAISIERGMLHRQILENERFEGQLRVAQEIQRRLLPQKPPRLEGYEIAGVCIPTFAVGGDYYDFIPLPDNKLGLVVADVSGDGVPAALIMTAFRALLRTHVRGEPGVIRVARWMNEQLPDFTGHVDFVTAVYGVLDLDNGRFRYTNCGHNQPLLLSPAGNITILDKGGPLLSIIEDAHYEAGEVTLQAGDLLLLYTDGVVEAVNPEDEEFRTERLLQILQKVGNMSVSAIIGEIVHAVQSFSTLEGFRDDLTMVAVRRL